MDGKLWMRRVVAAMVLGGVPGCDYFEDVTVPATDAYAPLAATGVWQHGAYLELSHTGLTPVSYSADLDQDYVLVAAGMDNGGIEKVTFQHSSTTSCSRPGSNETKQGHMADIVATQAGGVGQTVSNGLWTGRFVRLRDYAGCSPGYTMTSVTYSFRAVAEDFHGNVSTHGFANIHGSP